MRRSAAVALILLLAACIGAGLVQQAGRGAAAEPQAATPRQHDRIDQKQTLELQAQRAPADFGSTALRHLRTIYGFGPRHTGVAPTPGWSQQLDYVTAELRQLGLTVERDTWTDRKERVTFTNLLATIPGARP